MRYASIISDGSHRLACLDDDNRIWDLTTPTGFSSVQQALEAGPLPANTVPADELDPDRVRFLLPVAAPRRILCAGFNFPVHAAEAEAELPTHPSFFVRFPDAHVAHGEPVVVPAASTMLDWEGEVAIVIGRGGRHIERQHALKAVAGYTCFADNSVRDFQLHSTQATAGKNFDHSGSFGPVLADRESVPDPAMLEVFTRVNGEQMQHGKLCDLVFDVPTLIEYVSTWTTLQPGDVIATGTPPGIGARRDPMVFLQPGDTVEVEVPGIGTLRNPVVAEGGR